ncbi:hypothetical protein TeGR_g10590 [Tetraparma gracilis]|uniref:Tr-type G domain-containing protein n=1 Tax=Tetraparma gracilis TaxID=2962635 RepID=A0ABQ6M9G0_9STRA|nr:hypothetical protein TeGR_g10590 [Tetraparma gracilis]
MALRRSPALLNPSLLRNVGILAHVDAGKTTLTEHFVSLATQRPAGSVDEGSTVTDFLASERERGITIQSACLSLPWPPSPAEGAPSTRVNVIDTPGHVDFGVEVARSVAVLDGGVLVVDAVEGVQAQTETVWGAMQKHGGEAKPLPCLAVINKLDRVGADFGRAIGTLNKRLKRQEGGGATNATPVQLPLAVDGDFVGVVDVVASPPMRIVWPEKRAGGGRGLGGGEGVQVEAVEEGAVFEAAVKARGELVEVLADFNEEIEELYLGEEDVPVELLLRAIREATIANKIVPVLGAAALRRMGVEPVLDAVVSFLPSPEDCPPPVLLGVGGEGEVEVEGGGRRGNKKKKKKKKGGGGAGGGGALVPKGPPLGTCNSPHLLALAFKVIHQKGRGGGDGRVVFARIFGGELEAKKSLRAVSGGSGGGGKGKAERPAQVLELFGGRMEPVKTGIAKAGDVVAIVGLKDVVTGDTLVLSGDKYTEGVCLAGVTPPKPVLTLRLDAETTEDERKLEEALRILCVEDPSLVLVEEGADGEGGEEIGEGAGTMLSGLGELHLDITVDRLQKEFGVDVKTGEVQVSYKETLVEGSQLDTGGLVRYERDIGGKRMEGSVALRFERMGEGSGVGACFVEDNVVGFGEDARAWLKLEEGEEGQEGEEGEEGEAGEEGGEGEDMDNKLVEALVEGVRGALQRGPVGAAPLTNVKVVIEDVDCETGLAGAEANPGAFRAAAASAAAKCIRDNAGSFETIEPVMKLDVTVREEQVGAVLADFTTRGGQVGDVQSAGDFHVISGSVPLKSILGYATVLRSLSAGGGVFQAEYESHRRFSA